jgi:hypothetical protein
LNQPPIVATLIPSSIMTCTRSRVAEADFAPLCFVDLERDEAFFGLGEDEAQAGQDPPQSVPISSPFLWPSEHVDVAVGGVSASTHTKS